MKTQTQPTVMGPRQIAIIVLTLITALIHLSLMFPDVLFILNGLGFLGLLAAYFLPLPFLQKLRGLTRWALIAFTLVTILAWVVIGDKSWPAGALGYIAKLDELALLVLLIMDGRR